jgi:xylan 1,4-beta-xylosidase
LRVGGPATAQAAWVSAMIEHAASAGVPLDFVSTHVYGNDTAMDVFGKNVPVPPHGMVCAAVAKVHREIEASAQPKIPLIWSEFNATYLSQQQITDSVYMGPWLANTIRECDGMTSMMSYWTFSDVFEEQGVISKPFFGGFGLIAVGDLPKPSFNAFKILHSLGEERLLQSNPNVLVTRKTDGSLEIAAWNLVEPGRTSPSKLLHFKFTGLPRNAKLRIARVDETHGNVLAAYKTMGEPAFPSREQQEQLRQTAQLPEPEAGHLDGSTLKLLIPPQGLAVISIGR